MYTKHIHLIYTPYTDTHYIQTYIHANICTYCTQRHITSHTAHTHTYHTNTDAKYIYAIHMHNTHTHI